MIDAQTAIQLAAQASQFRPVAQAAVEEFKEFYLPLLRQAGEAVFNEGADARIKHFNRFRDELNIGDDIALELTLNLFNMFKQPQGAK